MKLTIEQIKKLTTKRLLNHFRIERSVLMGYFLGSHKRQIHSYIGFGTNKDIEEQEKYVEILREELNKREHVERD